MPSTPQPRSFSDIFNLISKVFVSKSGVNDLAVGSSNRDFLEAAALSDFRSQSDIMAALNSTDIDRAEGSDLDNLGNAEGVPRPQAKAASGVVTLGTTQFVKIATKVYAGAAAPPIGSIKVNIADGSQFPASGQVYIGRGSNNVEGPITYSSITHTGNFYTLNLSTPTTKNHNVNETVVLAQGGNRPVKVGTIVQTPANTTSPASTFRVLVSVVLPDGEDTLTGVPVVATQTGGASYGNVPANSITVFSNSPYLGATVNNPVGFINGADPTSDQDYRLLIKQAAQTAPKGTDLANTTAAVGVISTDDNQTVTSADILKPAARTQPSLLYIDNGNAYEPIFSGQGFETVVSSANGGEIYLQLQNEDITKALTVSSFATPFVLTGKVTLAVQVGGVRSEHTFQDSDFATQNAADTFEVINSINADTSLLFSAMAANNGQNVVIFAKSYVNEDIQVVVPASPTAVDANQFLGFDSNLIYTLRLYKNDILLIKDGIVPTIPTVSQANWLTMSSGETLTIKVDQSQYITYTFSDSDFVPFGYPTLSQNNSLISWANVINNKIAGITATVNGSTLVITSNKGANSLAALYINSASSTLASKMFGVSSGIITSLGVTSDYALNRATAQVQLTNPLVAGDVITAGSKNTRGFIESVSIATGTVSMPTGTPSVPGPIVWVSLDSPAIYIPSLANATSTITISNTATNIWRFTSNITNAFLNAQIGDWVVISDDAIFAFNNNFLGAWRISNCGAQFFEFEMTNALGLNGGPISLASSNKINFVRTIGSMQQINLLSGTNTLTTIATAANSTFQGGFASAIGGKVLRFTSNSYSTSGSIVLGGFTNATAILGLIVGSQDNSTVTHTAFAQAQTGELTFPEFISDTIAAGDATVPGQNIVTSTNLPNLGVNPDEFLAFLDTYSNDSSNKRLYTQIAALNGINVTLRPQAKMRDIVTNDRYFVAHPYDFDSSDNLVVVLDNDPINKALNVPLSREGVVSNVNAPTFTTFTAFDIDAGPAANYANQFGNNFNFGDFKIHFQAHQVLAPTGTNTKMLISATAFGPSGNGINFGIDYPTVPNSPLTYGVTSDLTTNVKVYLSSGTQRLGGAWDNTTQFDVTNPTGSTYRYTWTLGTAPNFISGAGVAVGDVVNIANSNFSINNTGTLRITAISNTYFEVLNPYGVVESNIQLLGASNLVFYPLNAANNTASLIGTFAAANLTDWVTITQLQSGTGVITTSTFDDNAGSSEYVNLTDGENWISSSNIGTTVSPLNQFTLKNPLTVSDVSFSLVGQNFYLIPTTTAQIVRFLNVFAVTGLSSLGNITASADASRPEIYSNLFGSSGSVLVSGGSANSAIAPVISSGGAVLQAEIENISITGTTVTVTTINKHDLVVGNKVTIADVNNSTFDTTSGYFTLIAATPHTFSYTQTIAFPTISTASRSTNVVTVTTAAAHNLAVGDVVTVAGVANASFDGTFLVVTAPTSNTFTYAQAGANTSSTGGALTYIQSSNGSVSTPYTTISINRANVAGFHSGQWVQIANAYTQAKVIGLQPGTNMSITGLNTLNIVSGPGSFQTLRTHSGTSSTQMKLEQQGQFICISYTNVGTNPAFIAGGVQEGDWVKIGGNFALVNQGIYKIVKMYNNSFYISASTDVEQVVTLSGNTDLIFYSYDSVMPGDRLFIESSVLGATNQGTYTVAASPFPSAGSITVTAPSFMANQGSTPLLLAYTSIVIQESTPYVAYKKLLNISRDPSNINGYVMILDGDILADKISVSAGAEVTAQSKLNFLTTTQIGEDSYKYYGGLIHAVGQTLRGEATDPIDYPGVSASGSYIEVTAPIPKRIKIAIVVRDLTGSVFTTIQANVQSTVSSYVNSLGVGQPVVFSEIIALVQQINGIQAVSIASPTYNTTNDQIISQANEKPVMISAITDCTVSLAT